MTPCRLTYSYQHFAATSCLHPMSPSPRRHYYANPNSVTSQKIGIFNNTTVRIKNFAEISLREESVLMFTYNLVMLEYLK